MKITKTLLFALLGVALASSALAQPAQIGFNYFPDGGPPLGCGCTGGTPYVDGTSICLYWDNNLNGPDNADVIPEEGNEYGEVNFACFSINGGAYEAPGYFVAESYMVFTQIVDVAQGDNPVYYLEINSGNCCWRSDTFRVSPGIIDWEMVASDWNCSSTACPRTGNPPVAPTNFSASDNARCLSVTMSWQHTGENLNNFNIYRERPGPDELVVQVPRTSREVTVAVYNSIQHTYYVKAANAGGESPASNTDVGSTYLIRFTNDLQGDSLAGSNFTMTYERPPAGNCPVAVHLWLLVNGQRHTPELCYDSLVTSNQMTCTLPTDTSLNNCKILMEAYSIDRTGVILYDTTESIFHLGRRVAVDDGPRGFRPDRFDLAQNYPNPFNPTTEIAFNVPVQADVRIAVYNLMGQHVRTLVNGSVSPGVHRIAWNGRSDSGSPVTAGVYLYRLEAPGTVVTKKMLLMK